MASMLFARPNGEWLDFPPLQMAGQSGKCLILPGKQDLIPLPEGATLTMMPGAPPYGFDGEVGAFLELDENPYEKKPEPIYAVAALLPQGFSRGLLPAIGSSRQKLPLLGYTAVGIEKGRLVVAAAQTDEHEPWHPRHYNTPELPDLVARRCQELPHNAILAQLGHCALEYGCFTAQNIFYRRWEGGIPVSPLCNAQCLGCISLQESHCCPAPQGRIKKAPSAEEIFEIALPHLKAAKENIISFGQGCEGEPSLEWRRIAQAMEKIRQETPSGTLNINTNGGSPQAIQELCQAGMDSFRFSLFSPLAADYQAYHRPQGYGLKQVEESLALAARHGAAVSLNLLAYPGYTDRLPLLKALVKLCKNTGVGQIQIRNLNIDPARMADFCPPECGIGLSAMLDFLRQALPEVALGNFSRPAKK